MKRGAVYIILLCVLCASAHALNETIGTFEKRAGQSWTIDELPVSIIHREQEVDTDVYLTIGNVTLNIPLHQCAQFYTYKACLLNATLKGTFDPELQTTPFTYTIKITADLAKAAFTFTLDKTTVYVGQMIRGTLELQNIGSTGMNDLEMYLDTKDFDIDNIQGPCAMDGRRISYRGQLFQGAKVSCYFDMQPWHDTSVALVPKANFSKGDTRKIENGPSITVKTKGSPLSVTFANATAKLGEAVPGVLNLNNTYGDDTAYFKVTLISPYVNGTKEFAESVPAGKSIGIPFVFGASRVGNSTMAVTGTLTTNSQIARLKYDRSVIVPQPRLFIKSFGQLKVKNGQIPSFTLEAHNDDVYVMKGLQLTFTGNNISLPPSRAIDLRQTENTQLYAATLSDARNDTAYLITVKASFLSPFGQSITVKKNITATVGSPKAVAKAKPTTPPPSNTSKAAEVTPKPAPTPPTTESTPQLPAQQGSLNANLLILVGIIVVIAGAILFFAWNARNAGPDDDT